MTEDRDDIDDDQEAVPLEVQVAEFRKMMQDVMELFEDQVAKGNEKFAERFIASHQMNRTLMDEVGHQRNMRSMPRTWGRYEIQRPCILSSKTTSGSDSSWPISKLVGLFT